MPNETNRRNIKTLMDLLSDAHADITKQASDINTTLLDVDETVHNQGAASNFYIKVANRKLAELEDLLAAQEARCARTQAEVVEIRKNLKVV